MKFFETLKLRLSLATYQNLANSALDFATIAQGTMKEPTALNYIRLALNGVKMMQACVGDESIYYERLVDGSKWEMVVPHCLKKQAVSLLTPHITSTETIADVKIYNVEIPSKEIDVMWLVDDSDDICAIYARKGKMSQSVEWIASLFYESVESKHIVLGSYDSPGTSRGAPKDMSQLQLAKDVFDGINDSNLAEEISDRLKMYLNSGYTRSVMFEGPPGTGKSSLVRSICKRLDLSSIRIRVEDISTAYGSNSTIYELLSMLKPDVIVLDDFDRSLHTTSLFEMLESFKINSKLIFATVNDKDRIETALRRPGRFDEIVKIERLDDVTIRRFLGDYSDVFDIVRDWPIAFINEYVIRRKVLGKLKADESIPEMIERLSLDKDSSSNSTSTVDDD